MAKNKEAIHRKILKHNPFFYDSLLHQVAVWRFEEGLAESKIAEELVKWVKKNIPEAYNEDGPLSAAPQSYIDDAIEKRFVKAGRFPGHHLAVKIRNKFSLTLDKPIIIIAPDRSEMLRYAWIDLDEILTRMIKVEQNKSVIVGVSGGHTMLDFAKRASSVADLQWHGVEDSEKNKVTVCSLTSGGIRTDIAALSDTVTAIISDFLKSQAKGLLGPTWFSGKKTRLAFSDDKDVRDHLDLVGRANIILTSVGYISDPNSLMRKLIDKANKSQFLAQNPLIADMLYNCYDGRNGKIVKLPKRVQEGLFTVTNIGKLKQMIDEGSYCFVLASGYDKGSHAMKPVLENGWASHVYLDISCAQGILGDDDKK
jgi:DNA-binding transcriptional regulator LsrR (DeoR family)